MARKIIEKRNTGISVLEKKYNTKYEYIAYDKCYVDINDDVVLEDCEKLEIFTKISDKSELDDFIEEMGKTDIFDFFERVEIHLSINNFYNGKNYITLMHVSKDINGNEDKYFSVIVHREKDFYY